MAYFRALNSEPWDAVTATKNELLEGFSRDRLVEIAFEFGVPVRATAPAKDLVLALMNVRRPTKAELEVLLPHRADQSVKGALLDEASEYYSKTALVGFEHHDALLVHVAGSIALAEIITPGVIDTLEKHLAGLRGVSLSTRDEMPKLIADSLSSGQWKGLRASRGLQWVWTSDGQELIKLANDNPDLVSYRRLTAAAIPDPGKRYLCLAWQAYASQQYDSNIVMLGRAVEFIVKGWLEGKPQAKFSKNANLGALILEYERVVGAKDAVFKYVSEVEALERNLSSHDHDPARIATPDVANHVWTGAIVLLRHLLGIELRLESIRVAGSLS